MPERTHYDILGVSGDASDEQIRAAFRRLAKTLHPDVNHTDTATEDFQKLQAAFDTLSHPLARREYDAEQRAKAAADAPTDMVDRVLEQFGIEPYHKPKKAKKKKAKRQRTANVFVEQLPDGFEGKDNLGGIL